MTIYNICLLILTFVFSLLLSIQDIKNHQVSNWLLLGAGAVLFVYQAAFFPKLHWLFILTGIGAGLFYFIVRLVSNKKLGMGDVYFGIIQGIVVFKNLFWLCIAVEVLSAFIYWLFNKKKENLQIPFIPFMSIGMIFCIIYGALILKM